ncbi:ferredoxin--NADP reductase [Mangrovivirga cuniculi]|uniref:Oxidoreductase n=1 Tax=Mangrovivirga cuniculi TaxID=2715131 RepID=A0A4D7JEI0_9BACT|nr:ferredoxin--NADP reductase [Mangrovivirga cuniculi]QCK14081.1 oxidoreductase [Mangrovivirga cuniculi]
MVFGLFKKKKKKPSGPDYVDLSVKDIIKETPDAITIVFDAPDMDYKPGQFLTLISDINGEEIRRSYSLCTYKEIDEYPAVTVKRVQGGKMSNYLNEALHIGDTITVMKPKGHFTVETNQANGRHIVLFGAGSGITPLKGIASQVLEDEPNSTVSLIYANRNHESIIFRNAWTEMIAKYENRLSVSHILEEASDNFEARTGLPSKEMLVELVNDLTGKDPAYYFMCGPAPFMEKVEEALEELNVPKEIVKKESFTPAKKKEIETDQSVQRTVKVIIDDEEHDVTVQPGQSILEAGLIMDLDMPFSCQSGMCTACRAKCLNGKVSMEESDALTDEELEEGYVLTCVGHPETDDVKLEFD